MGGVVKCGEVSGGASHLSAEEVCGTTQRGISQGGDPAGLELGAGWVEVAHARCQTMERLYLDDTAETEFRVVEDPPDQIRAVESRGETGGRGVGGGGRSDSAK